MPRFSIWWKLAAVGLIAYLAVAVFFGADAQAQKDDKDKDKDKKLEKPKDGPTKAYYGVSTCQGISGCHNEAIDADRNERSVVRLNEVKFWLANDKHSTAYRVLITDKKDAERYAKLHLARYGKKEREKLKLPSEEELVKEMDKANERARQMEKILAKTDRAKALVEKWKKKDKDATYKLIHDPGCLACHAQVIDEKFDDRDSKKDEKDDEKKTVHASFHEEEGVNCVVCHGPYKDWISGHAVPTGGVDAWRALKRTVKETDYGMNDLWDPAKRTKLCASCHVGHQGDGKDIPQRFVTHEMYAAGHPPLPSFEIATFSNEMPRHWDYIRAKDPEILKKQDVDPNLFKVEQTQLVLIGAATSLAEQMRLVAGQASVASEKKQLLDESNFDCYACHHGLMSDAWRQKRGYGNRRPGRLPMRPWATELIKLAIHYAEKTPDARKEQLAEFEKKLDAVKSAFTDRMFGDTRQINKTAQDLAGWADKLTDKLKEKGKKDPATEKDAKELYEAIPELYHTTNEKQWVDYDSARQVAWGFKVTFYEKNNLDWFSHKVRDKDGKEKDPSSEIKEVLTQLGKLDKQLKLQLPNKPKSIDDELDETMKRLNSYDPKEFNVLLQGLGKSLKK